MAARVSIPVDLILDADLQARPPWERWLWVYVEGKLAEGSGTCLVATAELVEMLAMRKDLKLRGPDKPAVYHALERIAERLHWKVESNLLGLRIERGKKHSWSKRVTRKDAWAEAYRDAYNARMPAKYQWSKADFVQLAKWRASYPDVAPEAFAAAAGRQWSRDVYCPRAALTIKGMCVGWDGMLAREQMQAIPMQTPAEKALAEARRQEAMEA